MNVCALALAVASWYGAENGNQTASGEHFNPMGMTAAHRTMPFGTMVTVTNPASGKSVTVRINDRGPFIAGRDIDLSQGAAQAIGCGGICKVKLSVGDQSVENTPSVPRKPRVKHDYAEKQYPKKSTPKMRRHVSVQDTHFINPYLFRSS